MPKTFYTILFCYIFNSAFAQIFEQSDQYYLPIGVGISFFQAKDDYNSPLRHRGFTSKFLTGIEHQGSNYWSKNNFSMQTANLKNGVKGSRLIDLNQAVFRGHTMFRTNSATDLDYFVGFTLKVNFNSRNSKRFVSYNGNVSLGLTATLVYQNEEIGDDFFFDATASLPLIGWGFGTQYASFRHEGDLSNLKATSNYITYLPKLFDLDLQFNCTYSLNNGNQLRLSYFWWYYNVKHHHRIRMLENGMAFWLVPNLN